jgi:drug/metabolite transporter (DMT)-like permease
MPRRHSRLRQAARFPGNVLRGGTIGATWRGLHSRRAAPGPPPSSDHDAPVHTRKAAAASVAALAGALALWASAFAAIRVALTGFSPAGLGLVRFAVASAMLGVLAIIRSPRRPPTGDVVRIGAAALLLFVIYNLGLNYGERHINAGTASLLIATAPLFTALIARGFLGERLHFAGWGGVIIGFLGCALIAVTSGGGLEFGLSALAVLAAAAAEAAGFVVQKPILARYSAVEFMACAVWAATAMMLPAAPAAVYDLREASPQALAAAAYLGIVPTVLAYTLWAIALKRLSPARAASFLYLLPAVAIAIAWAWLNEVPSLLALTGGGLALTGVAITNKRPRHVQDRGN